MYRILTLDVNQETDVKNSISNYSESTCTRASPSIGTFINKQWTHVKQCPKTKQSLALFEIISLVTEVFAD
jgi:hypothetical protein